MRQDFDLLRKIMLDIEELPPGGRLSSNAYPAELQPAVVEHMLMLKEAGFAEANIIKTMSTFGPGIATRLTHDGHAFLRQIRGDQQWSGVKKFSAEKGVELTIEVVK